MADARERHLQEIQTAKDELKTLHLDTPHKRDLLRHLHRLQKQLKEYDYYIAKGAD